jgi:BASS family bile acid:Na+ symporter
MGELYLRHEYQVAALQLAFAMLGIGATLHPRELLAVFRLPGSMAVGLVLQLVVVPLYAVVIMRLLPLTPGVVFGVALLASVPGGTLSNLVTYYGRANVALSVSLTALTTMACLVTTPLLAQLLVGESGAGTLVMPTRRIAFEIAYCLLGPLAMGMAVGLRLEASRARFASACVRLSFAMIFVMFVGSAAAGRVDVLSQGPAALVGLGAFAAGAQLIGLLGSAALGLPRADAVAIAIETTVRNTNLALLLKASIFPARPGVPDPIADGVLFAVLLYGGFALLAALPLARLHRRRG